MYVLGFGIGKSEGYARLHALRTGDRAEQVWDGHPSLESSGERMTPLEPQFPGVGQARRRGRRGGRFAF